MDNFINLAKQGYDAYEKSQNHGGTTVTHYRKTGGEEYNSPHHSQQGSGYGPHINHDEVVQAAQTHGSGDSSLFSSALSFIDQHKGQHHDPIDEGAVQESHRKAYDEGSGRDLPASSLGSAAALQVLKGFTSGKGSGGGSQTQLISMAMSEASKLFDRSGGASSGGKQDAVNGAALTVVKLLVQSKFSGGVTGGGNSGGLGGLMSLASKFL
ncbi:hypothetical protein B0F90DRAFT_1680642 [Multifurca ochricompacta]|uniref:DUF7721 domain-containing protein n=1 Tax=Multifurca ochricompacta TaxID=376703 RepID=A0AAD4MH29_9AGAM|nr:hypothetical protein B0F90DRAFT_1680642 [Multifurca ochricompacta]